MLAFDSVLEQPPHAQGLVAGTDAERWKMLEWLGKLDARGGTEMGPALEQALQLLSGNEVSGPQPILVFVTDGQVSGEDALLRRMATASGGVAPRVFTVGIDQAVNAGFLQRLADQGRGACELVESRRLRCTGAQARGNVHHEFPVLHQ